MIALLGLLQHFRRSADMPDRLRFRGHIMIRAAILALGLFCLLPQAARANDRCMEEGYLAHFDRRLRQRLPCDEITTAVIHWHGGSALLRAIHPRSMPITDSAAIIGHIREAADAVGLAIDAMGGNLQVDDVTLLFTNYVSPRGTGPDEGFDKGGYIGAASSVFAHECPVSYYKSRVGDDFVFTLAHEMFHCVQYRTWPSMPEERWLTEGSAEYFAYLAKPSFGAGYIPQFDHEITGVELNHLDYSAVVFYLWLGYAYGPPRVREFLASTSSIDSAVSPDMLSAFAQAYFAPTILMPDRRALPSNPAVGATRAIHGNVRILSPEVTPYTLNSEILTFDRDKIYQLTLSSEPPDARTLWGTEYGPLFRAESTTISTCDGEKRYRVIRTTTRSTRAGDINVVAQPASRSACVCPAGTWQETPASARRYFEQSGTPGEEHTRYIAGFRVLVLNPDHSGSLTYESVETETRGQDPDFWLHQIKTGTMRFTWKVVNRVLMTVLVHGNNLITLHNEIHTRRGVTVETRQAGGQTIGHGFYCDDGGLYLRQLARPPSPIPGLVTQFNANMDFVRIGGAP